MDRDRSRVGSSLSLASDILRSFRSGWAALWTGASRFVRRSLVALSIAAVVLGLLLATTSIDAPVRNAQGIVRMKTESQQSLSSITRNILAVRDSLSRDSVLRFVLSNSPRQQAVFNRLSFVSRNWIAGVPDAAEEFKVERGAAIYDPRGRLIAWNSSQPAIFAFDSTLPVMAGTERRSVGMFVENGPVYTYLSAFSKLQVDSRITGYVITKSLLAIQNPMAPQEERLRSFLDPIRRSVENDVQIQFNAASESLVSDAEWTRFSLQADSKDPGTFLARISVSDRISSGGRFYDVLSKAFLVAMASIILILLGWGLTFIRASHGEGDPVLRRLMYSIYAVALLTMTRYALLHFDAIGALLDPKYQDSFDFGSFWGAGLVSNPLNLFVSSIFLAIASVVLWLIWMPRRKLVREDSGTASIQLIVRQDARVLVPFALLSILTSQLLISLLGSVVEFLVTNGRVRFLVVRKVLPSEPELMMYLGILSIGIAFLFIGTLLLTFALRAIIYMLPRTRGLAGRVALGILALLTVESLIAFVFSSSPIVGIGYRFGATAILCLLSAGIIIADAFYSEEGEDAPSFLYRLPRSSRAVLFILTASAVLMSPLVAQKGVKRDVVNARSIRDQATSSSASIEPTMFSAFNALPDNISQWFLPSAPRSLLEQLAFLIYTTEFSGQPDWSVAIDVRSLDGRTISHFASTSISDDIERARPTRAVVEDTALKLGARSERPSVRSEQCFTRSCNPLVASAKVVPITRLGQEVLVSIAIWSELPTLNRTASAFDLLETRDAYSNASELIQEGEFILAHYRPGMRVLTNVPSLDVPSELPSGVQAVLPERESLSRITQVNSASYFTQYFYLPSKVAGVAASVLTVSVPLPSPSRILEFGLRLNAIGLVYGIIIAILVLIVRQLNSKRVKIALRFRDRIFLVVLAIALLPLVIVTTVTQDLLRNRANLEDRDRILRDAQAINDEITSQIARPERAVDSILKPFVTDLAGVLGRDFNVFGTDGILRAASRPELYESSILSTTLSPRAMQEIVFGRKTFYTERLPVGNQTIRVGYRPIGTAEHEKPLAVVSVATLEEAGKIEAEVARTTSLIYGTFAALGVVLLGIGAVFAARVASPILRLIRATKNVAGGELSTTIPVDRQDEIGELMQAFNSMTGELEKSREKVAQTERELAWKEMARQVAHEIKNPLTPMRLSVQHLEHAHEMKDPNFGVIFKRVSKTLGEQIDLLTRIASEFSRFGEMPRRRYRAVQVRKVAESAIALFDSERHRIRFIIDIPQGVSPIHADEEEFRRTLVNLIRNAIQAIEGWGVIAIRVSEDRGMIRIKLSDTGLGMNEETLTKAFDPNFSTKTSGMGLGLAIVKKTITDMSGSITVDSKMGQGTTFLIDLPARKSMIDGTAE